MYAFSRAAKGRRISRWLKVRSASGTPRHGAGRTLPRSCGCCDSKVGFEAISSPMQPMQTLWLHGSGCGALGFGAGVLERGLLGGGEAAQALRVAAAPQLGLVRLGPRASVLDNAHEAR